MDLTGKTASALMAGGISIAALHALIPSHWLAFALVGRAHRWPMRRTLSAVILAGTGHVLMTTVVGCVVAAVGKDISRAIPGYLEHAATATLLVLLGGYFILTAARHRRDHCGVHVDYVHDDADTVAAEPNSDGRAALTRQKAARTTLAAMAVGMTLSPCLDLLPVYVAAAALSWLMIIVLSVVMSVVTLATMVGLVWLSCHGLAQINLRWLEHNEGYAVGGILVALGIVLVWL